MKRLINAFRHQSLTVKLPLTLAAIIYGAVLIAGTVSVIREVAVVRAGLERNAEQLVRAIALQNRESVAQRDYWAMYASLQRHVSLLRRPDNPFLFGAIIGVDGTVLAHTNPEQQRIGQPLAIKKELPGLVELPSQPVIRYVTHQEEEVLLAGAPVMADAAIWLVYDTAFIDQRMWGQGIRLALLATVLAILGGLGGWVISRNMVRPLDEITSAVAQVKSGQLSAVEPVRVAEQDEIGRLADVFNKLAEELKEKKKLEEQIRFQEKLAAVGRMVSGVAHEINNPLGGMKNALESVKLVGDDREKREEGLRLLSLGLEHIEGVVQALLVGSRSVKDEEQCGARCLDEIYLLIQPDCESHGIRLRWENQLDPQVQVPCTALQQILLNLLINGVKAMPKGGVLTYRARTLEEEKVVEFQVEDEGVGMSQEQAEKIFEPFSTASPGGVGLGLWVCLQLVEAMEGELWVDSEEGHGSCFTVRVPRDEAIHVSEEKGCDTCQTLSG